MAEGTFGIKWRAVKETPAFFGLSQTSEPLLIEAIQQVFGFFYTIDRNNNHYVLETTSVKGIQVIINFFLSPAHQPLVGYKGEQFRKWLNDQKTVPRYRNLIIPNI